MNRNIRLYDNGGKTADRYTAINMRQKLPNGCYDAFGFDENPFHPLGFGQHCTAQPGRHLGKRIQPSELPPQALRAFNLFSEG